MRGVLYVILLLCMFTSCNDSQTETEGQSDIIYTTASEGKTYLYQEDIEEDTVESDFAKAMKADLDSIFTPLGGHRQTKEEKEFYDFQINNRFKLVVDHFNSNIVYDVDYNATYHFTVINRINKPIIAFEMGYNDPFVDGKVINVKRFKQRIEPNYAFDGQLSLEGVPEDVTFYAISLITEDGVKHDIHKQIELEEYMLRRKYNQ